MSKLQTSNLFCKLPKMLTIHCTLWSTGAAMWIASQLWDQRDKRHKECCTSLADDCRERYFSLWSQITLPVESPMSWFSWQLLDVRQFFPYVCRNTQLKLPDVKAYSFTWSKSGSKRKTFVSVFSRYERVLIRTIRNRDISFDFL